TCPGLFILGLVVGGLAEIDGRLRRDDRILEINDQDIRNGTQAEAAAIIQAAEDKVTFLVSRRTRPQTPDLIQAASSDSLSDLCRGQLPPPALASGYAGFASCAPPLGRRSLPYQTDSGAGPMDPMDDESDYQGRVVRGDIPVYVTNLQPDGLAARSRQVRKGDVLLAVNDIPLLGLSHEEAVRLLKAQEGPVAVRLLPGSESSSGGGNFMPSWVYWLSLPPVCYLERNVDLARDPCTGSLGFSIVGGADSLAGPQPIIVKSVVYGGPAHEDGRLRCGDMITRVNGDCRLAGFTHGQAVALLKSLRCDTVLLTVVSWPGTITASLTALYSSLRSGSLLCWRISRPVARHWRQLSWLTKSTDRLMPLCRLRTWANVAECRCRFQNNVRGGFRPYLIRRPGGHEDGVALELHNHGGAQAALESEPVQLRRSQVGARLLRQRVAAAIFGAGSQEAAQFGGVGRPEDVPEGAGQTGVHGDGAQDAGVNAGPLQCGEGGGLLLLQRVLRSGHVGQQHGQVGWLAVQRECAGSLGARHAVGAGEPGRRAAGRQVAAAAGSGVLGKRHSLGELGQRQAERLAGGRAEPQRKRVACGGILQPALHAVEAVPEVAGGAGGQLGAGVAVQHAASAAGQAAAQTARMPPGVGSSGGSGWQAVGHHNWEAAAPVPLEGQAAGAVGLARRLREAQDEAPVVRGLRVWVCRAVGGYWRRRRRRRLRRGERRHAEAGNGGGEAGEGVPRDVGGQQQAVGLVRLPTDRAVACGCHAAAWTKPRRWPVGGGGGSGCCGGGWVGEAAVGAEGVAALAAAEVGAEQRCTAVAPSDAADVSTAPKRRGVRAIAPGSAVAGAQLALLAGEFLEGFADKTQQPSGLRGDDARGGGCGGSVWRLAQPGGQVLGLGLGCPVSAGHDSSGRLGHGGGVLPGWPALATLRQLGAGELRARRVLNELLKAALVVLATVLVERPG
uniref:PDZ domain-containing protein n=1 Tax=Macrostomum lignano TaxID=282301 RepID=A0A1I8IPH9_9PLAT